MAAAAIPFLVKAAPAIAQSVGGLFQTLFSGRKKAQREMEAQLDKSPAYTANKGISDYYQEALNRYNENPMQTAMYQNQMRNAQRVTAQGIGALQDRRSALAGIGRLAQVQNDASQNALANAERLKESRFSTLGQAAGMKAGEERRAFDINVMTPYQRRLQMAQMKASAANARSDAGMQNMFGGLSNLSMMMGSKPTDVAMPRQQEMGMGQQVMQPQRNLGTFGNTRSINNPRSANIQMNPVLYGSGNANLFNNPIPYSE
jgi:hypothetical protein